MANKNMSSRLLNMKFMQRAAASSPTAPPTTPDGGRPSKRQRMSTDAVSPDVQAFQDAAAAEEAKRNAFIERAAAEAGETKWVLSVQDDTPKNTQSPLRIVNAGYGAIDSGAPIPESDDEEEEQSAGMAGRRSFGKFNKVIERQHNPDLSSSESEEDSDDNSEDSDEELDDADELIKTSRKEAAAKVRADRKAQKKQETEKAKKMADRRRSKEVNLNKVGGISNATIKAKQGNVSNMACHICGQKGHLQRDCPDAKQRKKDKARS